MIQSFRQVTNAQGEPKYLVLYGVLVTVGITLLFQVGSGIVLAFVRGPVGASLGIGAGQLLLMLIPAVIAARRFDGAVSEYRFNIPPLPWFLGAIIGIITLWPLLQSYLLLQELYLIPHSWLNGYHELEQSTDSFYSSLFGGNGAIALLVAIVTASIIPGICEETLFRGLLLRSLLRRLSAGAAIPLTALVFALLHVQPITFVPLLGLGLFLGFLAWSSDSIYPSMLGHAFFNSVTIIALQTGLEVHSGKVPTPTPSVEMLRDSLFVALPALALLVAMLLLMYRNRRTFVLASIETDEVSPSA